MLISPPFLPPPDPDDEKFISSAMLDSIDSAPGTSGAPLGSYPLTTALTWHNGIHLKAPKDKLNVPLPVCAIADGIIIFKRTPSQQNNSSGHPQNHNPFGHAPAWTDNGIVILRHSTEIGASQNTCTPLVYYSVYMHLSAIDANVGENLKIFRKSVIGTSGSILGTPHQIHFEICLDKVNLGNLLGPTHTLNWTEPKTPPQKNGRTDSVFGKTYIFLPVGTPTRVAKPTSHFGTPASAPLKDPLWVSIEYKHGDSHIKTYYFDGPLAGEPIGTISSPNEEYNLYIEAKTRHASIPSSIPQTSSISGWFELLRFGRNLGTDPLPVGVEHWRKVATTTGDVWIDLNWSSGTGAGVKIFSDADFPTFSGWQCFDDDTSNENQRCDSVELKRAIRDSKFPESIRDRIALTKRLGRDDIREKLKTAICRFPTEWDQTTILARYEWIKTDSDLKLSVQAWNAFEDHAVSLSFANLPKEYLNAVWHIHPRVFIRHMRHCKWLSSSELILILAKAPKAGQTRAEGLRVPFNKMISKYLVSETNVRLSHFLAQVGHETDWWQSREEYGDSDYFRTMYEIITPTEAAANYDRAVAKQRLLPSGQSPTKISRAQYVATRPAKVAAKAAAMDNGIANAVQGGRQGDGETFKGRGFLQITGRRNYRSYGTYRGLDFTSSISHSSLLAHDDANACDASGFYWVREAINAVADNGPSAQTVLQTGGVVNRGRASAIPGHHVERQNSFTSIWKILNDE